MSTHQPPEARQAIQPADAYYRSFGDILPEMAHGAVNAALSKSLAELTAAVVEAGKPGTVTLVVTLKPIKDAPREALTVSAEVKIKKPGDALPGSLFYGDRDGLLSRKDPRQLTIDDI